MKANNKNALYLVLVALTAVVIYKIYYEHKKSKALKNSILVIAKVENIEYTRGATFVYAIYQINGKHLHGCYATYDREALDSLKNYKFIRLRVSRQFPEEYVEYVGIEASYQDH